MECLTFHFDPFSAGDLSFVDNGLGTAQSISAAPNAGFEDQAAVDLLADPVPEAEVAAAAGAGGKPFLI